jgi:uncharacterized membrane protein
MLFINLTFLSRIVGFILIWIPLNMLTKDNDGLFFNEMKYIIVKIPDFFLLAVISFVILNWYETRTLLEH